MTKTQKTVSLTCAIIAIILFAIYLIGGLITEGASKEVPCGTLPAVALQCPETQQFFPDAEEWSIFYGK